MMSILKRYSNYAHSIILTLLGCAFFFALMFGQKEFYITFDQKTADYLMDAASQRAVVLRNNIREMMVSLNTLASLLAESDDITSPEMLQTFMEGNNSFSFERIFVTRPNGISFSADGEIENMMRHAFFRDAMRGIPSVSGVFLTFHDVSRVIVIATPIRKGADVIGVLGVIFDEAVFSWLFSPSVLGGKGHSYIINDVGDIVVSPVGEAEETYVKYDNFFDVVTDDASNVELLRGKGIKDGIKDRARGVLKYHFKGEQRYLCYMPIGINNWNIVFVLNKATVDERFAEMSLMLRYLGGFMAVIFFGFSFALVWFYRENMMRIEQTRAEIEALTRNIPGGVSFCTLNGVRSFVEISESYFELFGVTREQFKALYGDLFVNSVHEDDREQVVMTMAEQIRHFGSCRLNYRLARPDGKVVWVMEMGRLVKNNGGTRLYCSVTLDVTDIMIAREQLALNEERYRVLMENANEYIFEWKVAQGSLFLSEQYKERFGELGSSLFGVRRKVHHDDEKQFMEFIRMLIAGAPRGETELRLKSKNDEYVWCNIKTVSLIDDYGKLMRVLGVISDIDSAARERRMLLQKSMRDSLTGIYNKGTTRSLIENFLSLEENTGHHALFLVDVDDFKSINDNFGHHMGDVVLADAASSMKKIFRADDIVGRIGGDEFMVLMKDVPSLDIVSKKGAELQKVFQQYRSAVDESQLCRISGSIGIALFPENGITYLELYNRADCALYEAKKRGKNRYVYYEDGMAQPDAVKRRDDAPKSEQKSVANNIFEYMLEILYSATDARSTVNMMLGVLCRHVDTERGYIYEFDDVAMTASCVYEWYADGIPHLEMNGKKMPESYYHRFIQRFDEDDLSLINVAGDDNDDGAANLLRIEGARSALVCAIRYQGKIWGALGFNDYKTPNRVPTADEAKLLKMLAKVLGSYLILDRKQEKLKQSELVRNAIITVLGDKE